MNARKYSAMFGKSLRELRTAKGMSMQDVADLPGVSASRTKIWAIESGDNKSLPIDDAIELCAALGVGLQDMLDGTVTLSYDLDAALDDALARLEALRKA